MGLINVPAWQIKFPIKFPIHTPCSSKPFATLLSHCPIHLGRTFCTPHFSLMTRQLRSDYRTKSMSHLVQSCQMHPLAFVHTHNPPAKTLTPVHRTQWTFLLESSWLQPTNHLPVQTLPCIKASFHLLSRRVIYRNSVKFHCDHS